MTEPVNGSLTPRATLPDDGDAGARTSGSRSGFAPPAPPPPTELDGLRARLVEHEQTIQRWENWAERVAASGKQGPAERQPSQMLVKARTLPKRYAVPLCIAGATLAATVGIVRGTPRHSEAQVASLAAAQITPTIDQRWEAQRAEATTVVVQDPLSAYGLDLTEDARTAIGWVGSTGNLYLNPARSEYVAKQVRILSASVKLLDLRLTSKDASDLRVHTNPAEGFALFKPPATRAPDVAPTSTSAP